MNDSSQERSRRDKSIKETRNISARKTYRPTFFSSMEEDKHQTENLDDFADCQNFLNNEWTYDKSALGQDKNQNLVKDSKNNENNNKRKMKSIMRWKEDNQANELTLNITNNHMQSQTAYTQNLIMRPS